MSKREALGVLVLVVTLTTAILWATWEWQGPVLAGRVDDVEARLAAVEAAIMGAPVEDG